MPKSPTLRFEKHLKLQQQEWKENAAVFLKYSPLNVEQTVTLPSDISARNKKLQRDAEIALKAEREKMKVEWQKRHPQVGSQYINISY